MAAGTDGPDPRPPDAHLTAQLSTADGRMEVQVDVAVGPRITSLSGPDGRNVLVHLVPPAVAGPPDGPRVPLHGGHRLWVAPETVEVTYRLDDTIGTLRRGPGTAVTLNDVGTPIRRTVSVTAEESVFLVRHQIENTGSLPVTAAPWAISQVRSGGTAVVPISVAPRDPHGFQAAGCLVTWPYTDLSDERYAFFPGCVTIEGRSRSGEEDTTKIGVDGFVPWVAYAIDGMLFVAITAPRDDTLYTDLGATTQVFTHRRFTELESLGPLVNLAPGEQSHLDQRWALVEDPSETGTCDWEQIVEMATALATRHVV